MSAEPTFEIERTGDTPASTETDVIIEDSDTPLPEFQIVEAFDPAQACASMHEPRPFDGWDDIW